MTTTTSSVETMILRQLAFCTQKAVADAIGAEETHVSRFASGERGLRITQLGPALKAMGLKIVPADEVTVDAAEFKAVQTIASLYFLKTGK